MELTLRNTDLQIQQAQWSFGPKPQGESVSRTIVVQIQRYDIKSKILKTVKAKRITCVKEKRLCLHMTFLVRWTIRDYKDIKKILKEKQIQFQTPYWQDEDSHGKTGPASTTAQLKLMRTWEGEATHWTGGKWQTPTGNRDSPQTHTGAKRMEIALF